MLLSTSQLRHCGDESFDGDGSDSISANDAGRLASRTANSISHLAISTVVRPSSSPSPTAPPPPNARPGQAGRCRTGQNVGGAPD